MIHAILCWSADGLTASLAGIIDAADVPGEAYACALKTTPEKRYAVVAFDSPAAMGAFINPTRKHGEKT